MKITHEVTEVTVEDKQVLDQAQIQSLEILGMDVVELEEFLQNEYMSNPMMEHTANHDMNSETETVVPIHPGDELLLASNTRFIVLEGIPKR